MLVNNSGATFGAPYDDFPEKQGWDRVLGPNVKGVYYLTAALTPLLAKGANNIDPGRVIVIASVAGLTSIPSSDLSGEGMGLWSCPSPLPVLDVPADLTLSAQTTPRKPRPSRSPTTLPSLCPTSSSPSTRSAPVVRSLSWPCPTLERSVALAQSTRAG